MVFQKITILNHIFNIVSVYMLKGRCLLFSAVVELNATFWLGSRLDIGEKLNL